VLDAVCVELRSLSERFDAGLCGALLRSVCATVRRCVAMGIHTDVATPADLRAVAAFIASVDPGIPWHVAGGGGAPARAAGLRFVYGPGRF
jgi:hypothetical protein